MPKIRKEGVGGVSFVTYADPDVPDHPSSAQAELEHGDRPVRTQVTAEDTAEHDFRLDDEQPGPVQGGSKEAGEGPVGPASARSAQRSSR
jgi:hypothetical protein